MCDHFRGKIYPEVESADNISITVDACPRMETWIEM